ncbi:MAG TPA: SDR family NAD(P)-dependent oxidoreductase [Polyangiaceae bacterium]|jgi:NADP-dependent 3-hydroxy acid dehydrogenase YdfG|nr:SDR family NAD(P)-dependent oxidoreductase [Polyangiaceae bacterium]
MSKTLLVAGFGPGISTAVAEKFGKEGFSIALVARNAERLQAGAQALQAKGIQAAAFPADLSDPARIPALIESVRRQLSPLSVVHWNAYGGGAGDLLSADLAEVRALFEIPITSLLATLRAALPDLRQQKDAALLVTNGGLGLFDDQVDTLAVQWNAMGLAVANSAKHKLVRVLAQKLKPEGIYVGEVMVLGLVKGTPWDQGNATLEARSVAEKFWELYSARSQVGVSIS